MIVKIKITGDNEVYLLKLLGELEESKELEKAARTAFHAAEPYSAERRSAERQVHFQLEMQFTLNAGIGRIIMSEPHEILTEG